MTDMLNPEITAKTRERGNKRLPIPDDTAPPWPCEAKLIPYSRFTQEGMS
jgi:hypothetical protein